MRRKNATDFVLKLIVMLLMLLAAGTFPLGSVAGWNSTPETRPRRTWFASVSPADRGQTEAKSESPGVPVGPWASTWYGYYWSEPGFALAYHRKSSKEDVPENAARMSLNIKPRKAELMVDGFPVGEAGEQTLYLSPGSHQVEIRHSGYRTLSLAMDVTRGQIYDVRYRLKRGEGTDSPSAAQIGEL